jgi:isopentenyl-diphosphate delta-isomerase
MKIPIVNEKDEIICHKNRHEEKQMDLYRVSGLWITNSKGEILLARRAYNKLHSPGAWGPAVAGTVEEGETYESNIKKETKEELGLDLELKKNVKVLRKSKERKHNFFCQWFTANIDVPAEEINFQKEEIAEVKWFTEKEIIDMVNNKSDKFGLSLEEIVNKEIVFD